MRQQPSLVEEFTLPYRVLQDTEWMIDPANPTDHQRGLIRQGETIWFHPDQIGSGPAWQRVRLVDQTLCYVHLIDFKL